MKNENLYTSDSLNAVHHIKNTTHELNDIIYAMKELGIPAGEKLEDIRNHLLLLSEECSTHLMSEQNEQLRITQNATWDLVGAVFTDAVDKMK